MEAENFGIEELAVLTKLADSKGIKVYIAFNSIIKQGELDKVSKILKKIAKYVHPHALIVQDPGMIPLARQAGFKGEFHLSTLGNCCFTKGLEPVKNAGFSRVVMPRELNIDEIKAMAEKTPKGLELEVFIHGALCYGVSGRCYWSSWFGGKSGLRGRCVQPCRRIYTQNRNKQRFFSCFDLSLDVLVKVLKNIPQVTCWKIEGRKKSAHYVFYTVKAYKMLRDHGHEPDKKKTALAFLNYALGRPATHYNFLPQRPQNPLKKDVETGSGLFTGRVKFDTKPYFITREALLTNDLLRIGYEDDQGHAIQRVTRSVPKKGKLVLKQGKKGKFKKGMPIFIVDRKENDIALLIKKLEAELEKIQRPHVMPLELKLNGRPKSSQVEPKSSQVNPKLSQVKTKASQVKTKASNIKAKASNVKAKTKSHANVIKTMDIFLKRTLSDFNQSGQGRFRQNYSGKDYSGKDYSGKDNFGKDYFGKNYSRRKKTRSSGENIVRHNALWLSKRNIDKIPGKLVKNIWWWLPPVIWPGKDEQNCCNLVNKVLLKQGRLFVLNIPWQISLFNLSDQYTSNKYTTGKFANGKGTTGKGTTGKGTTGKGTTGKGTAGKGTAGKFTTGKYRYPSDQSMKTGRVKGLSLWAGPFCNITNSACINSIKEMGFSGAIVSPELDQDTFLSLPEFSPLPLGAVIKGNWPLSISRTISDDIKLDQFFSSPMGENCWVSKKDENYWVFPGWQLDLSTKKEEMIKAGYSVFIDMDENIPKNIIMKKRPGLWNWKLRLL